jgi:hypothetical protein
MKGDKLNRQKGVKSQARKWEKTGKKRVKMTGKGVDKDRQGAS